MAGRGVTLAKHTSTIAVDQGVRHKLQKVLKKADKPPVFIAVKKFKRLSNRQLLMTREAGMKMKGQSSSSLRSLQTNCSREPI